MALKKTSKFGAIEGLTFEYTVPNAQQEQEVCTTSTRSTTGTTVEPEIVFGSTQGKKGHKAPRINMAFSPEVHAWIKTSSRQQGVSATEFVNAILKKEMEKSE